MDPSEFGKLFRLFLGLPSHRSPRGNHHPHEHDGGEGEPADPRDQVMPREDRGERNFTVLTDPLEIHRFFEQQMDDMLRNFGQGFGGLGRGAIGMEPQEEEPAGSARDFMLKDEGQPRVDTDLDSNQVDMGELETLMRRKETRREEEEAGRGRRDLFGALIGEGGLFSGGQGGGGGIFGGLGGDDGGSNTFLRSFGTSVVEKTVSLPGGGVETCRTVRNSDGTEVVTVTRQVGDQAHQQTTITDREGNSSTVNKFTNVEEGRLPQWGVERAEEGWEVQPSPREEMMSPPADQLYGSLWKKFWGN